MNLNSGPVQLNDMQTTQTTPSKVTNFFWSKKLRNNLKRRKNQFSVFCDL